MTPTNYNITNIIIEMIHIPEPDSSFPIFYNWHFHVTSQRTTVDSWNIRESSLPLPTQIAYLYIHHRQYHCDMDVPIHVVVKIPRLTIRYWSSSNLICNTPGFPSLQKKLLLCGWDQTFYRRRTASITLHIRLYRAIKQQRFLPCQCNRLIYESDIVVSMY